MPFTFARRSPTESIFETSQRETAAHNYYLQRSTLKELSQPHLKLLPEGDC
jgi:hypothetical protein